MALVASTQALVELDFVQGALALERWDDASRALENRFQSDDGDTTIVPTC
jgi:hypothetical protein